MLFADIRKRHRTQGALLQIIATHTERVASTGDTAAARRAGPYTASWPSSHSNSAPMPSTHSGIRGNS
jgi:hypothetical protein